MIPHEKATGTEKTWTEASDDKDTVTSVIMFELAFLASPTFICILLLFSGKPKKTAELLHYL